MAEEQIITADKAALMVQGEIVYVGPGLYLNDEAALTHAKRITSLEAENKSLKSSLDVIAATPSGPSFLTMALVAVVCIAAGASAVVIAR